MIGPRRRRRATSYVLAALAAVAMVVAPTTVGAQTGTGTPDDSPGLDQPELFVDETDAAPVVEAPSPRSLTAYGAAPDLGPATGSRTRPIAAIAADPGGGGYWLADPAGTIDPFGAATPLGSIVVALHAPIVGMAPTPTGDGSWLVASDGGIFTFGDAPFLGSLGATPLNAPIVGIAPTPTGDGYWLVASDGGIFTFGDAPFLGSLGATPLNAPIVGIAPTSTGNGYWLVASDGGTFTFGDAPFLGSAARDPLDQRAVGIAASPDGGGYWVATLDGQVFEFGVPDHGSPATTDTPWTTAPTVGIAATTGGYWIVHGTPLELGPADEGPGVRALQERLQELGYWVGPVDGIYGDLTRQAVLAFQKHDGLALSGEVDQTTRAALATASRPVPASSEGDLVEVDKTRQLLMVVRGGEVLWTFNTSTGTEEPYVYEGQTYLADTPTGHYTMDRQIDGIRISHLGRLYRPKYVVGGIAVHGYPHVPSYPASHGCIRVSNAAMDLIWTEGLLPLGSPVWIYGTSP